MEPIDRSQLIAFLEEYGSQWKDLCEFIKVYNHPNYTSLRLVKGDRDVGICFTYNHWVDIAVSSPSPKETNEEWLSEPIGYWRPGYSVHLFAMERFPNEYRWIFNKISRLDNQDDLNQVKRYLAINHEVIDLFVRVQLKDPLDPTPRAPLIALLEEYGNQWKEVCDSIKVYNHPCYTTLRLVKGERDISMSLESEGPIQIAKSSPGPKETVEEWLSKSVGYNRLRYSICEFAQEHFPNQSKRMVKKLFRHVNRNDLTKVRRFLAFNHEVIDLFVRDQLKDKMEPVERSQLIAFLEEYSSPWKDLCDFIKVYDNPSCTSLRLVKGDRSIGLFFEWNRNVSITASSPGPLETNEEWLSKSGGYMRPSYGIQEFAKERFHKEYRGFIKKIGRRVNRDNLDQIKRYIAINHEVIDLFVRDQLNDLMDPTPRAPLVALLEEYGNQWNKFCDSIRVYNHPNFTVLRLATSKRDVSIQFKWNREVYIKSSTPDPKETKEEWFSKSDSKKRPLYLIYWFVKKQLPHQSKRVIKNIDRRVNRGKLDQAERYLAINHKVIDLFVRDQLKK